MGKIIGIDNMQFKAYRRAFPDGSKNGAYYYAKEIEENIIPLVKTSRDWDCLGMKITNHFNHSIIFLHHNLNFNKVYKWLSRYKDIVLVASSWTTYGAAKDAGYKVIYVPLSIDIEYVKQFKTKKTKKACYAGNKWGFKLKDLRALVPSYVDYPPENMPREELLKFVAPYKECYAVGRCALEAKALGCKIKVCDSRYPDPKYWKLLDNKDAAKILQKELDKIDN